jgi:hypothetical protein
VNVVKFVGGSQTTLKSDTSTKVTTSNATYNFRFRWEVGGAYYFKAWIGTAAEPAAWNCNGVTDTTYNSGAVGVYVAARGATTDTVLWNQFYVSYSDLNEDTTADGLTLSDASSTFTIAENAPTDSLSAPTDSQAWVVNPAPTDSLTSDDSATTFALSDTFPVDNLTQVDASGATIIQNQSDVLAAPTDSEAWIVGFKPTETLTEVETQLFALSDTFAADSASASDVITPNSGPSLSDTLTEAESAAYAISETAPIDSVSNAESPVYTITKSNTDSVSNAESSAYALAQNNAAITLAVTEIDASAEYFSVEEDLITSDTQLEAIVETPASDIVTLTESKSFVIADKFPSDSIANAETNLTAVTQTDITTLGTASDSIVFGQPGVIFPDQLTITDSIQQAEVPSQLTDVPLLPSDLLQWDTNFTDHVEIDESVQLSYSSSLLDSRSVLYSNTISDGPAAYYQLNEDSFGGIYQRDGSDQPNNASIPILYGSMLEYTWAQIEPQEGNRLFSTIDADILPWKNQDKKVILRVFVSSTPFYNNAHNNNTAGQATPTWVFSAGAPSVTGLDGAVYPVYWDSTFLAKYTNFVNAFANYYDENSTVAGVIISCGVNGTTALEASGDTQSNTTALWTPRGYTPTQWMEGIVNIIDIYQAAFQHTPLILSVNDAVIAPDNVYNIHQCISIAVAEAAWLMDENVYINEQHNDPNWNIVPLITVPRVSIASGNTPDTLDGELTLAINYQADYAAVWADDITLDNETTLTKYFSLAQSKGLNDSASSNFKMAIFGGVYPTSHISTGDYLNGAQQFDGLTGFGYIGKLAQTNTDKWTLKCTVFPQVLPMSEAIAFSVGNDGSTGYGGYAIGISGGANGGAGAKFCAHLPGLGWYDSGYSFPEVGQWYQLFVTFDGVTLRFYANGVLCPNTYNVTANAPSLAMTIGAQWDGMTRTAKRFFIGSVDECAVYPFALAPSRVLALSDIEYGMNELLTGSGNLFSATEQLAIDDASSLTNVIEIASDTLSVTEGFAYSIASSNTAAYEVLAEDMFNRLVSSGLGNATDGNAWQIKAGASSYLVDGAEGQATGSTSANVLFLGDNDDDLQDVQVTFQISDTSSTFGLIAFGTDASNYYSLRAGANLQLYKTVAGTSTTLGTGAAFTLSANTWYHLHLKVSKGILYGNVWANGSAEPVGWMVTASDTAFSSGSSGLYIVGASNGTTFKFTNFFAIDNVLSDFVYLQEIYTFTSILPPLVDTIPTIIDASITAPDLEFIDTGLSIAEVPAPVDEATGIDFLLFGVSTQAWAMSYSPTEQLTEQEGIATPVIVDFPADAAPTLSDAITPYVTPVPVDQIAPSETVAEVYTANLVDQMTLVDASTVTQIRNIVDADPSKRYIMRAFGAPIIVKKSAPLIAGDKIVPTDNPTDTSSLTLSDSVAHGPAFLLSDTLTITESVLYVINETIPTDATAGPTDNIVPTIIPSPIDLVTEQEIIIFAVGPILPPDLTGSVIEEDVTFLESDTFDPDLATVDDSTSQETVAFAPIEIVAIPDDATFSVATFATVESVTISENATFVVATFATDSATVSDAATQYTVAPVPTEIVANSELVAYLEVATLLPDTPIEAESILSTEARAFTTENVATTDAVQSVTNNFEETDFATIEIATTMVQDLATDNLTVAETTLDTDAQAALDNLTFADEQDNFVVFNSEQDVVLIDSDFIFTLEAVAGTDLVSESESLIQIETFIYSLPDIALPNPVELGAFTVIPVPIDTVISAEGIAESLSLAFDADSAPASDALLETISTSFTGWLDLLFLASLVQYAVTLAAVETENELESFVFSSASTYQDNSTPNTEENAVIVTQLEAEQSSIVESSNATVQIFATEQSVATESNTVVVVLLGDVALQLSENATFASQIVATENATIFDATMFTVANDTLPDDATILDNATITNIATVSDATILEDVTMFTVADATPFDVATILDLATFATIMAPMDDATILDFATLSYVVAEVDTSSIADVSKTTNVTLSSDGLQAGENVLYSTIMAPVENQTLQEVLTTTLIHAETDSDAIEELLSGVGYGLLDDSLNIVEVSNISSASYIKTFGIVRTGQVDGIIRTGNSTGVIRTGLVDGVIS